MKIVAAVLALFVSLQAHAIKIPADKDVMRSFGTCNSQYLPNTFQLFVWNIKKGESKNDWARDFENFAAKSEIILLQESMMDNFIPKVALRQKNFCWNFATSFLENDGDATGVMNGSQTRTVWNKFLRSPGREPVLNSPKMALVEEYALANRLDTLWVVNVHGLNFVPDNANRQQIEQIAAYLKSHKGPIIFAGDFNSWNKNRLTYLNEILSRLNLLELTFPNDPRSLKLDHIYIRGLQPTRWNLHNNINTSDHKPLTAEFQL